MKKLYTTVIITSALLVSACTTFGRKAQSGDDDGTATALDQSSVVVQAGQKNPVASEHDRNYWLDMRQSKELLPKMQGALATGEHEAAVGIAKAYLAKHPGDVKALAILASALVVSRKYELAGYYASLLERAQPGHPVALNVKGMATMLKPKARAAEYQVAKAYFEEAFKTGTEVAAGLNLGNLHLELGNPAAAAGIFDQVVERCGRCTAGLMGLGVTASRSRNFAKAESAFQEVLKKNPNHAGALYNMALVQKNGYNNAKEAEKYLFAVLNDSRTRNAQIKERAQTVLRMIKGEATAEEKAMIADEDDHEAAPQGEQGTGDERDAELLMTGAEAEAR